MSPYFISRDLVVLVIKPPDSNSHSKPWPQRLLRYFARNVGTPENMAKLDRNYFVNTKIFPKSAFSEVDWQEFLKFLQTRER